MTLKRFHLLERRFSRDEKLKNTYIETIHEYIKLGQMHPVTSAESKNKMTNENGPFYKSCYLPHHPVVKESSTSTKVRVVFDASAKTTNGKSLNDILAIGSPLQTDLASVLINWRFLRFVFMPDIEKMYRRININKEDAQYQRILWRSNPNEPIQDYYCSTVMFGTSSAPFTAIRTMHQLAEDEAKNIFLWL